MTADEFQTLINIRKEMEFTFKGTKYNLFYEKDSNGKEFICFGELYFESRYESLGELLNTAKVSNTYFKNIIEDL